MGADGTAVLTSTARLQPARLQPPRLNFGCIFIDHLGQYLPSSWG